MTKKQTGRGRTASTGRAKKLKVKKETLKDLNTKPGKGVKGGRGTAGWVGGAGCFVAETAFYCPNPK
jgi:hypothetical protein